MMRGMVIDMKDEQLSTLAQLRAFVDGTAVVDFAVTGEARYDFIARTVRRFGYARLKRPDQAVVLRLSGARERLFASADHATGPTRRHPCTSAQGLLRLAHELRAHLYRRRRAAARAHRHPARHALRTPPPRSSWSAPSGYSATLATSAWQRSRWRICTPCASVPATLAIDGAGPRPVR